MSGGIDNPNTFECCRCGLITSMKVHDQNACDGRLKQREVRSKQCIEIIHEAMSLKENKMSPTPSDIDLAKTLFSAFKGSSFSIYPNVPEFESYTLKQIKELADIARKIR